MPEVFTDHWAKACAQELNTRPSYREAALTWEGAIVLVMAPEGGGGETTGRSVLLDLWHGECRHARVATGEDLDAARYVLQGTPAIWREVLAGRLAPILAIMTGKLRLAKGSFAGLVPYVNAAKELVAAAMAVETTFPEAFA